MFDLAHPEWLWMLLLLVPFLYWELVVKTKRQVRLPHPSLDLVRMAAGKQSRFRHLSVILRSLVIILLVFALARPRIAMELERVIGGDKDTELVTKGIDIVLAIDVSGSMQAIDFQPVNRLEAAKKCAADFIRNRPTDQIGLVVFSDFAYTQCPLTRSRELLDQFVKDIRIDNDMNGTAIGMGLSMAVARLRNSKNPNKTVILITDGRNNTGKIQPYDAAEMARLYGIKVYPIGVGRRGDVDFPVSDQFGRTYYRKVRSDVDMETLNKIAELTGTGRAWRAENTVELASIIERIDKKEKEEIKHERYYEYSEVFEYFLFFALGLLILEFLGRAVLRRELP